MTRTARTHHPAVCWLLLLLQLTRPAISQSNSTTVSSSTVPTSQSGAASQPSSAPPSSQPGSTTQLATTDPTADPTVSTADYTSDKPVTTTPPLLNAPENITITNVTHRSFVVLWQPPGGAVQHYIIYVSDAEKNFTKKVPGNTTAYQVSNLTAYTTYQVGVSAVNHNNMEGKMSDITNVTTSEWRPGSAPKITVITNTSAGNELNISWIPPQTPNGIITHYLVNVTDTQTGGSNSYTTNLTSLVTEPLRYYHNYSVTVLASTGIGEGPTSQPVRAQTDEGIPSKPFNFTVRKVNASEVCLSWEDPKEPNGIITSFTLQHNRTDQDRVLIRGEYMVCIGNLDYWTPYQFIISANTSKGRGNASELTQRTDEYFPGPVVGTTINCTNTTNDTLTVTWQPPAHPNGRILNYTVSYHLIHRIQPEDDLTVYSTVVTETKALLSDHIFPYRDYKITVQARTSIGLGKPSNSSQCSTEIGAPKAPPNVTAAAVSATTVTVAWTRAALMTGPTNYTVSVYNSSSPIKTVSKTGFNSTAARVDGLKPYKNYTFMLTAVTAAGKVQASDRPSAQTLEARPDDAPGNIVITNTSAGNELNISWIPPQTPNGVITYYQVNVTDTQTENSTSYTTNLTSLVTEPLRHYHNYSVTVLAATVIGEGPTSQPVRAQTDEGRPDDAPGNIVISNTSAGNELNISWIPPQTPNGVITYYQVNVTDTQTGGSTSYTTNLTSLVTEPLHYYHNYSVTILAATVIGEGPTSQPVTAQTDEGIPGPVVGTTINCTDTTNDTLTVTWQPPAHPNGRILNYTVSYHLIHRIQPEDNLTMYNIVVTKTRSVLSDHIFPYRAYEITIKARTRIGFGKPSNSSQCSAKIGVPKAPLSVTAAAVSATEVNVTWTRAALMTGPTSYTVSVYHSNSFIRNVSKAGFNSTAVAVDGLQPYKNYTFVLTAGTAAGQAQATDRPSAQTHQAIPGSAPEIIGITNTSAGNQLNISWSSPRTPNGVITNYQVNVTDTQTGGSTSYTTNLTSLVTESLRYYHNYTVTILAATVIGEGPTSKAVLAQTDEGLPSKPVNFTVLNVNASEVCLSWDDPEEPNGIIMSFTLRHNRTDKDRVLTKGEYRVCIGNLDYWTPYEFVISANTSKGRGNASELTQRTDEYYPGPVNGTTFKCSTTNDTLSVRWQRPARPNGVILDYNVSYRLVNKLQPEDSLTLHSTVVNETSADLSTHILPFRSYTIQVRARTRIGLGQESNSHICETKIGAPKPPSDVKSEVISSYSVNVTWKKPYLKTGPTNYTVTTYDTQDKIKTFHTVHGFDNTSYVVPGLRPYWNYTFSIEASTAVGSAKAGGDSTNQTLEAVPGKVVEFTVTRKTDIYTSISANWTAPSKYSRHGKILVYRIDYQGVQNFNGSAVGNVGELVECENKTFLYNVTDPDNPGSYSTHLDVCAQFNYTVQITAKTNPGFGDTSDPEQISIPSGAPPAYNSEVGSFAETSANNTVTDKTKQIEVLLKRAFFTNYLHGLVVDVGLIIIGNSSREFDEPFRGNRQTYEEKLRTNYTIWSKISANRRKTPPPYRATSPSWSDKVIKEINAGSNRRKRRSLADQIILKRILGEDGDCVNTKDSPCNGYLSPDSIYRIRGFACTQAGCTETPYSITVKTEAAASSSPSIAAIVVPVIVGVILILVLVGVLVQRYRNKPKSESGSGETRISSKSGKINEGAELEEIKRNRPVALKDFSNYVAYMHKDTDYFFSTEYQTLKDISPKRAWTASEFPINRIKNRYVNILPFDATRVKLLPTEEEDGSDYINANYIQGYNSKREYIAAQGPLPSTVDAFWRMIWEQNVNTIVMLTNLLERGRPKCEQYWPRVEGEPEFYGDLQVTLRSTSTLPDYVIRILDVQLEYATRIIYHFHFIKWPDFGSPRDTHSLLEFVHYVRHHQKNPFIVIDKLVTVKHYQFITWPDMGCCKRSEDLVNFVEVTRHEIPPSPSGPMLVHCSAGVGRTGTFIMMDILLQHISEHDYVDVFGEALKLRECRCNMVQTEDQYIFIHDCIRDLMEAGLNPQSEVTTLTEEDVDVYANAEFNNGKFNMAEQQL